MMTILPASSASSNVKRVAGGGRREHRVHRVVVEQKLKAVKHLATARDVVVAFKILVEEVAQRRRTEPRLNQSKDMMPSDGR
ncbi:MAG: hypothetical protein ACRECL_01705 [Bradyrhizobium sp.]